MLLVDWYLVLLTDYVFKRNKLKVVVLPFEIDIRVKSLLHFVL